MRIESSVTSISWIPSAAIAGTTKIPFELGVTHYDDPPPDEWKDLDSVLGSEGARFPTTCGPGSTSRTAGSLGMGRVVAEGRPTLWSAWGNAGRGRGHRPSGPEAGIGCR